MTLLKRNDQAALGKPPDAVCAPLHNVDGVADHQAIGCDRRLTARHVSLHGHFRPDPAVIKPGQAEVGPDVPGNPRFVLRPFAELLGDFSRPLSVNIGVTMTPVR